MWSGWGGQGEAASRLERRKRPGCDPAPPAETQSLELGDAGRFSALSLGSGGCENLAEHMSGSKQANGPDGHRDLGCSAVRQLPLSGTSWDSVSPLWAGQPQSQIPTPISSQSS
ncbi:hypothetical protein P7K49_005996, partial [Saguinus oedipus]